MCMIDEKLCRIVLPGGGKSGTAWKVYHVVKHVLAEENLELHKVIDIPAMEIRSLSRSLKKDYHCSLLRSKNLHEMTGRDCEQCPGLEKCGALLAPLITCYTAHLVETIRKDYKKPRHIHYATEKNPNNLAFLNERGVIVITRKVERSTHERLEMKSGFRPNPNPAEDDNMKAQIRKVFPDRYYYTLANELIRKRVDRGAYLNTKLVAQENWQ